MRELVVAGVPLLVRGLLLCLADQGVSLGSDVFTFSHLGCEAMRIARDGQVGPTGAAATEFLCLAWDLTASGGEWPPEAVFTGQQIYDALIWDGNDAARREEVPFWGEVLGSRGNSLVVQYGCKAIRQAVARRICDGEWLLRQGKTRLEVTVGTVERLVTGGIPLVGQEFDPLNGSVRQVVAPGVDLLDKHVRQAILKWDQGVAWTLLQAPGVPWSCPVCGAPQMFQHAEDLMSMVACRVVDCPMHTAPVWRKLAPVILGALHQALYEVEVEMKQNPSVVAAMGRLILHLVYVVALYAQAAPSGFGLEVASDFSEFSNHVAALVNEADRRSPGLARRVVDARDWFKFPTAQRSP